MDLRSLRCSFLSMTSFGMTALLYLMSSPSQAAEPVNPRAGDVTLWPQQISPYTLDPQLEDKISAQLSHMTLPQKVAQMIQPEIRDFSVAEMRQYGFGSYLNGGGSFPQNNKHASATDWISLAETLYQASIDPSLDGSSIPTMWGTDAVHGHNNVIGATLFPHNIGLGATHNPELIAQIAAATAKEVAVTGIDWVFAPTVAVVRDDRWGRSYEGYSEDPQLVKGYAGAFVEGMQGDLKSQFTQPQQVISTAKHFVGDGGTVNGDDQGDVQISEAELVELHAQGYVSAIQAGVQTIMVSFNSWFDVKNHGNHYLLTEVLKQRMGFDGLLVGDWNGHGQIKGCSNESCPEAINAGLDIFMAPTRSWKPLYYNTIKQVEEGTIAMSRIDDAVRRILRVKHRAGLFEKASPAKRALSGKSQWIGHQSHRDLARQAVRESLVLLKNNQSLLPLPAHSKVLVAGDGADNIGKQSGGWSITWQGTGNENKDFPNGSSIFDGIQQIVEQAGGEALLLDPNTTNQAYRNPQGELFKPDVAIVIFGEEPYAEGNGDLANLEYQRGDKRDLALLKRLQAQNIPVVSVFLTGRPLWVNPEINASDAFVVAWLPGTEGDGVAEVLFQSKEKPAYDFQGRLSFSWPAHPDPTHPDADHTDTSHASAKPLFAYGEGLSYQASEQYATDLPQLDEHTTTAQQQLAKLSLFTGTVQKPWRLLLGEADALVTVNRNVIDLEEISLREIDKDIQQDARRVQFKAQQRGRLQFQASFPQDLRAYGENGAQLMMDVRVQGNDVQPLTLQIEQGRYQLAATQLSQFNQWQTLAIPLACFQLSSAQLAQVFMPLALESTGDWRLEFANVRWQAVDLQAQANSSNTGQCAL